MIDYGILPPEINSGRMYMGAGSGPMLAAATAWDVLAEELSLTAASFESTVLDLSSGPWRGPTAVSMAAAALPFTTWFKATAAQAEEAAAQAKAAAAAYETAFAMTVPPQVVAANRIQLMTLIATNFFGQNTPAIAATEAHYAAMWAQDAVAMYGYLGGSTTASQLSEFTSPPRTTNPAGPGEDVGVAATDAADAATAWTTFSPASAQPASPAVVAPQAVAQVGASTVAPAVPGTATPTVVTSLQPLVKQLTMFTSLANSALGPQRLFDATGQELNGWEDAPNGYAGARDVLAEMTKAAESAAKSVGTASVVTPAAGVNLPAAGLGKAAQVGMLSVPSSWPGQPGVANPATAALVSSRVAAAETGGVSRTGFGMPGIPGASATGGATGLRFVPRYGYRHKVMNRPTSVG